MDYAGEKPQQHEHGYDPGDFPHQTLLDHRRRHLHQLQRLLRCGNPPPQEGADEGSGRGREAPPQDLPAAGLGDLVVRRRLHSLHLVPDVDFLHLGQGPPLRLLVRHLLVPVLAAERVPQPGHVQPGQRQAEEGNLEGVERVEEEKVKVCYVETWLRRVKKCSVNRVYFI